MNASSINYEVQTIDTKTEVERCCVSWTGGKDCNLALLQAWRDPSLHVTCLVVFKPENKIDFDAHPLRLMQAQSESLGLPLRIMTLHSSESYRHGYINAFKTLRDEHQITVICTGDMDLVGNSTTNWMEECAEMVHGSPKIRISIPLWKASRKECLQKLLNERFDVIFSCIKSPWFDESWCGKKIDLATFHNMEAMSKTCDTGTLKIQHDWHSRDPRRNLLDLGGENGEYHTMVLDGPMYKYGIEIVHLSKPKANITEPAKKGEEQDRWWTYDGQTIWSLGLDFVVTKRPK